MELRKIRTFFSVIEYGNLSGAAQSLRVSQPTLSRQIHAIEQEYEAAPFVRGGRGTMLTEAGKQLHERLQSIERQLHLRDQRGCRLDGVRGRSRLRHPALAARADPPLVKQYHAAWPRIAVRLVEETSGRLRDLIVERNAWCRRHKNS